MVLSDKAVADRRVATSWALTKVPARGIDLESIDDEAGRPCMHEVQLLVLLTTRIRVIMVADDAVACSRGRVHVDTKCCDTEVITDRLPSRIGIRDPTAGDTRGAWNVSAGHVRHDTAIVDPGVSLQRSIPPTTPLPLPPPPPRPPPPPPPPPVRQRRDGFLDGGPNHIVAEQILVVRPGGRDKLLREVEVLIRHRPPSIAVAGRNPPSWSLFLAGEGKVTTVRRDLARPFHLPGSDRYLVRHV